MTTAPTGRTPVIGDTEMLLHQELARARQDARQGDARRAHRLAVLVAARRLARRERAARQRARQAADASAYAALRLAEVR